ncbi:hypothetical protein GWI68_10065 [Proteus sp. G2669]|uniref:hypothetical protein n=1 Tax=Proteus sp. G2669 TaxID=2698881 RepID=UPI001412996D|nr:hypothetical protein [Proteus sp. G2669]NBM55126.1 hypothetical protein [Proteus sp. G2669]
MFFIAVNTAYIANVLNPKAIMLSFAIISSNAGTTPTLDNHLTLSSIHILIMNLWLIACWWFYFIVITKDQY